MCPFEFNTYRSEDIKIIYSRNQSEDDYMIVAHAFLQKLMKEVARLSLKCYRRDYGVANMPYYYSERRLDSVVLPALSNICDGTVLAELPVERRDKKTGEIVGSGNGRADYWCIFRDYSFVIEMKGSWKRLDCKSIRKHSFVQRYAKMIEQLENIGDDCRTLPESTKGVIRIGLHFISPWANHEPDDELTAEYKSGIKQTLVDFYEKIHKTFHSTKFDPSYEAAWIVPDEIVNFCDDGTYPAVMLVAKVFKAIPDSSDK